MVRNYTMARNEITTERVTRTISYVSFTQSKAAASRKNSDWNMIRKGGEEDSNKFLDFLSPASSLFLHKDIRMVFPDISDSYSCGCANKS